MTGIAIVSGKEDGMKNYIDLHMHSIYSDDGEFTPRELVLKCVEAGVRIMAIADHNSVKAIDEEKATCLEAGIICIPALEIDCTYQGINLHVLGYGIDHTRQDIQALETNVYQQEVACSEQKLALTNQLGFQLEKADLERLSSNGVWTGEMFAEVLLGKEEYQDAELLKPYREGGRRSDNPFVNFYWDYYAQGKPCYTEIVYPSLEETIQLIHQAGGKAVLAHPGNNLKGCFERFDEMVALGLDGVEAFSSYHSPETINYFYQKGLAYGLLITSGSDFHGKTKPAIAINGSQCTIDQQTTEMQLKQAGLIAEK